MPELRILSSERETDPGMEPGTQKGSSPGFLGMLQGGVHPRAVCGFWLHLSLPYFLISLPDLWGSNRSQLENTSLCSLEGWWKIWHSLSLCGCEARISHVDTGGCLLCPPYKIIEGVKWNCVLDMVLYMERYLREGITNILNKHWEWVKNGAQISNKHSYSLIHTGFMKSFWHSAMVWIFVSSKICLLKC